MIELLDIVVDVAAEPAVHTLKHFLWQGSAVALLLAGVLMVFRPRSSDVRYRLACAALLLMVVLPMLTGARFMLNESGLWDPRDAAAVTGDADPSPAPWATRDAVKQLAQSVPVSEFSSETVGALLRRVVVRVEDPYTARWILITWFSGVCLLSILHLGGWLRIQRLRTVNIEPVSPAWQERADRLCATMSIRTTVRLLRSTAVQIPAVIGWLRPVVLIPAGALTGLSVEQLECILAHELAHIRRRDFLVNLLQICAETLLFFHPAVWWVSRQIRFERENCCDDAAIAVAGDRVLYARSLIDLEELRLASPRLALGADGGSLLWRIKRLIGGPEMSLHSNRNLLAGLAAILIILAGGSVLALAAQAQLTEAVALAGGGALTEDAIRGRWIAERDGDSLDLQLRNRRSGDRKHRGNWSNGHMVALDAFEGLEFAEDAEFTLRREAGVFTFTGHFEGESRSAEGSGSFTFTPDPDYVAALDDLGTMRIGDLELMVLAIQDLRLATVSELRDMGYGPFDDDELVTVAIFEIAPSFVHAMERAGYENIPMDNLVSMRVHDVDMEFIEEMRAAGVRTDSTDDLVSWRVHDIDAHYVSEMETAFGDLDANHLVSLKIHDVTPAYAKAMAEEGIDADSVDDLLSYRIHGITSRYIHEIRSEFGHDMSADDVLSFKIHGVSGDYVHDLEQAGLDDLSSEDLLSMKIHGVTRAFVEALADLGYKDIDADDLLSLRIHGATPKWIRHLHDKGLDDLDVKDLVKLRISGIEL